MNKRYLYVLTTLVFIVFLLIPTPNANAVTAWNELAYDDNQAPESYLVPEVNDSVAVRFSPPADYFRLTGMNIRSDTNNLSKICVWVLDNNLQVIMNPNIEETESFRSFAAFGTRKPPVVIVTIDP